MPKMSERYPEYYKDVSHLDEVDVYAVHELFNVGDPSGALHHASKKLLLSGQRTGGKSKYKDIKEARDTLTRWLDLQDSAKPKSPVGKVVKKSEVRKMSGNSRSAGIEDIYPSDSRVWEAKEPDGDA